MGGISSGTFDRDCGFTQDNTVSAQREDTFQFQTAEAFLPDSPRKVADKQGYPVRTYSRRQPPMRGTGAMVSSPDRLDTSDIADTQDGQTGGDPNQGDEQRGITKRAKPPVPIKSVATIEEDAHYNVPDSDSHRENDALGGVEADERIVLVDHSRYSVGISARRRRSTLSCVPQYLEFNWRFPHYGRSHFR